MNATARNDVTLYIGGCFASAAPATLRTVLGSCIAVCLFDPTCGVGGMNHFMLPGSAGLATDPARFGVESMARLMREMERLGALPHRLIAKVFGGGHVLDGFAVEGAVSTLNVEFIDRYLAETRISVVARDVGGREPRSVRFETATGRAFVRRIPRQQPDDGVRRGE